MTAEQLLIEENKINPKIKFITKSRNEIWFWRSKPKYLGYWCNGSGYKIGMSVTFDGKEDNDCILCIDDIKPEVPPIPEKWYIKCTKENRDILNRWRLTKARYYILDCYFSSGSILFSDDSISKDGSYYYFGGLPKNNQKIDDYQEITLEQFKKYVLISEEKQEEIQEPNDFKLSGIPYMSNNPISIDINGDPFKTTNNNGTFEFYPTRCWVEDRINYINQFIKKNIDSDLCINPEWINERNELIEKLKNL